MVWRSCGARYDRSSAVTLAGIEGAIGCDAADLLIGRNLIEQFGQHRRIADVAGGELGRTDFQRLFVDPYVDLAPDAPLRTAMLARLRPRS